MTKISRGFRWYLSRIMATWLRTQTQIHHRPNYWFFCSAQPYLYNEGLGQVKVYKLALMLKFVEILHKFLILRLDFAVHFLFMMMMIMLKVQLFMMQIKIFNLFLLFIVAL